MQWSWIYCNRQAITISANTNQPQPTTDTLNAFVSVCRPIPSMSFSRFDTSFSHILIYKLGNIPAHYSDTIFRLFIMSHKVADICHEFKFITYNVLHIYIYKCILLYPKVIEYINTVDTCWYIFLKANQTCGPRTGHLSFDRLSTAIVSSNIVPIMNINLVLAVPVRKTN